MFIKTLNRGHLSVCLLWLRQFVTGLSPQRPGLNSRPVCVGFAVDKVCWSRFMSGYFCFPLSGSFYPCCILIFICMLFLPEGQTDDAWEHPTITCVSEVREHGIQKYFQFFFSHKTWHWNRIFSENLNFSPLLSFHQCSILSFILLLLYQKGKLVKPGNLQKAMLFSKSWEHWIEKYFHFFSHRPCHG